MTANPKYHSPLPKASTELARSFQPAHFVLVVLLTLFQPFLAFFHTFTSTPKPRVTGHIFKEGTVARLSGRQLRIPAARKVEVKTSNSTVISVTSTNIPPIILNPLLAIEGVWDDAVQKTASALAYSASFFGYNWQVKKT
ncbi:hypothetical protein DFS34DRAFT_623357 [Phlyctochytrium arcticum]|nr:hypothetical protein DFS34DRAFT_623357 [Phlyctochytrium arcticum]